MAIPIWNKKTGLVFLDHFDTGVVRTLGGVETQSISSLKDTTKADYHQCFWMTIDLGNGVFDKIPMYFGSPDAGFKEQKFPFISINRDDAAPNMLRYMGVQQLEYRAGVSGTEFYSTQRGLSGFLDYENKYQAMPYDMVYTISAWAGPSEINAIKIIRQVLRAFPPVGRLVVYDSIGVKRTYEVYTEGGLIPLTEVSDPVTRIRGYGITIRVEGELDLVDPYLSQAVSGIILDVKRFK